MCVHFFKRDSPSEKRTAGVSWSTPPVWECVSTLSLTVEPTQSGNSRSWRTGWRTVTHVSPLCCLGPCYLMEKPAYASSLSLPHASHLSSFCPQCSVYSSRLPSTFARGLFSAFVFLVPLCVILRRWLDKRVYDWSWNKFLIDDHL